MKQHYFAESVDRQKVDPADLKVYLRKLILSERNALSKAVREELSAQMSEIALMVDEVANAKTVALYVSSKSEPQTDLLLRVLKLRQKDVLLPVLGDGLKRGWAQFISADDLITRLPGRPPEPSSKDLGEDAVSTADVLLAPALAIDTAGTRLGHGGGWYDRALLLKRPDVPVFALVYDEEVYNATTRPLPSEEHDILIDGYITPSKFVRFSALP